MRKTFPVARRAARSQISQLGFLCLLYSLFLWYFGASQVPDVHLGAQRWLTFPCLFLLLVSLFKRRRYATFTLIGIDLMIMLTNILLMDFDFSIPFRTWRINESILRPYLPVLELSGLISSFTIGGIALLGSSKQRRGPEEPEIFPLADSEMPIRTWLRWVVVTCVGLAITTMGAALIWSSGYTGGGGRPFLPAEMVRFGGLLSIYLTGGIIYQMFVYKHRRINDRRLFQGRVMFLLFFLPNSIGKGSRSLFLGVGLIFLVLSYEYLIANRIRVPVQRIIALGVLLIAIIWILLFVGHVRGKGYKNVTWEDVYTLDPINFKERQVNLDNIVPAIIQFTAAASLYHQGQGRYGETYKNLLIQQIPGIVFRFLGLDRMSLAGEDAWNLGEAGFYTGGGAYVLSQHYWNFGITGMFVASLLMGLLLLYFETWRLSGPIYRRWLYFGGFITIPYGQLYGLQTLTRAILAPIILGFVIRIIRNFTMTSRSATLPSKRINPVDRKSLTR